MARQFTVMINQAEVPLRKPLQAAIQALQFPLTVEDEYVPFASAGYLACTLNGEDAGVMVRFLKVDPPCEKDGCIHLQWSSDPREQSTAYIIATALALEFDAIVLDDQQQYVSSSELSAMSKAALAELET